VALVEPAEVLGLDETRPSPGWVTSRTATAAITAAVNTDKATIHNVLRRRRECWARWRLRRDPGFTVAPAEPLTLRPLRRSDAGGPSPLDGSSATYEPLRARSR
jgi:hypothetical protein